MVIQSNMSPKAIVEVWGITAPIFAEFKVPLTKLTLESIVESETLPNLLNKLYAAVGNSKATCVDGG